MKMRWIIAGLLVGLLGAMTPSSQCARASAGRQDSASNAGGSARRGGNHVNAWTNRNMYGYVVKKGIGLFPIDPNVKVTVRRERTGVTYQATYQKGYGWPACQGRWYLNNMPTEEWYVVTATSPVYGTATVRGYMPRALAGDCKFPDLNVAR